MVRVRSTRAASATLREGARNHSFDAVAAAAKEKTHHGKEAFR